jgi:aldehyde:ferredoxin oxidoreductase
MINGWTGKRLRVDLTLQKAWSEDIAPEDMHQWLGGRGLNASFFSQHFQSPVFPSSPENPIAFAVGPLTGTLAPCSGWTSMASFSPLYDPSLYAFTRMPGNFGASLKGTGFDQCILSGKADRPIYLWIDGGKVKFEDASHLWGKETVETTAAIQEEKKDRSIEVLCIGPAGERHLPFSNVTHRLSWTGDHVGLGYLFGAKQLKAITIRGTKPVTFHDPKRFLNLCLTLKDRIHKDQKIRMKREEGTFGFLGREGGTTIKKGSEGQLLESENQWANSMKNYLSGLESCFACPVHCGRNIPHQESYIGGIHLEKAWQLGPRIGVFNGEWTLKLYHLCQTQGLDPFLTGCLLAGIMEGDENGSLLDEELRDFDNIWDTGEKAFTILDRIIKGSKNGFRLSVPPVPENGDLEVLGDIIPFCTIVVNRLNLMTVTNIIDLIHAATGYALSKENLQETVRNILEMESVLQKKVGNWYDRSSFPQVGEGQISNMPRREEHNHESIVNRTTS